LSEGELKRVLLARTTLGNPDLIVLDEPTAGVDVSGEIRMYELIGELRDQLQSAVLLVSHDLHLVMSQTDQVLCLNQTCAVQGCPSRSVSTRSTWRCSGNRCPIRSRSTRIITITCTMFRARLAGIIMTEWLDDFLLRAVIAGLIMVTIAAPMG